MPYLPGPLTLQDAANVGITTTNYDFTDFTATFLSDVQPTLDGWQPFFDDATLLLDEPEDPYPDLDLNGMQDALDTYNDPTTLLGVADILTGLGAAAINLSSAVGEAPAEAWTAPTAPFIAPAAAEVISTPFIPFGSIQVKVAGATATGPTILAPPPATNPATVTLSNITRIGSGNFWVGDQAQISVVGAKGASIYVRSALNGQDLGSTYIGSVGSDGTFTSSYTETPDAVGVWEQIWSVGAQNVATFDFQVFSSD